MANSVFDCSGVATKYNVKCADGRTIASGAFDDMDGKKVPVCWNHDHKDPENTIGYAILHASNDGMRADTYLDDSEKANHVRGLLKMGTPLTYSINANQLVQRGSEVLHGIIREVSIVLAGANPGAIIDSMHPALVHADGYWSDEEAIICFEDELNHSDDEEVTPTEEDEKDEKEETLEYDLEEAEGDEELEHADEKKEEKPEEKKESGEETVQDVLDSMTDKQRDVTFALIGMTENGKSEEKEGGKEMAHTNVFDNEPAVKQHELTHADKMQILELAQKEGSFKNGIQAWAESNLSEDELSHGIDDDTFEYLLPEFKNVNGEGEPEVWTDDMAWVNDVVAGAYKVPFARVKTEMLDARGLRAKGYKKGAKKKNIGDAKVLHRTTAPTMVYAKDEIDRQDALELKTNFELVPFINKMMQQHLKLELAIATLFGDGREVGDPDKVDENCIRPIWTDDELYVIHADLDVDAMAAELQGTDTKTYFGTGFIESEAMIKTILDAKTWKHGCIHGPT